MVYAYVTPTHEEHTMDTTYWLLATGAPAAYLAMADVYIKMYIRMGPERFILPRAHKDVAPLIEDYAYDLAGFVELTKQVRDTAAAKGDSGTAADVHDIYRTLYTRLTQQVRRQRSDKIISLIAEQWRDPEPNERLEWRRKIDRYLADKRASTLNENRGQYRVRRLTRDETTEVLTDFWQQMDAQLEAGRIDDELLRMITDE